LDEKVQDEIVRSITSFAAYGFPESHAASFALIAYASAYLKIHYLAAFTAAILNNQPMGFYHPATLIKDAQRHGLRVKPIDVTCSDWLCTIENDTVPRPVATGRSDVPQSSHSIENDTVPGAVATGSRSGAVASSHSMRLGLKYVR